MVFKIRGEPGNAIHYRDLVEELNRRNVAISGRDPALTPKYLDFQLSHALRTLPSQTSQRLPVRLNFAL